MDSARVHKRLQTPSNGNLQQKIVLVFCTFFLSFCNWKDLSLLLLNIILFLTPTYRGYLKLCLTLQVLKLEVSTALISILCFFITQVILQNPQSGPRIPSLDVPSVQFSLSVMSDSLQPQTVACQASLSITNSWSLLKLMSIKSLMSSNHLILSHPLLLLPSIFRSSRVFSNESVLHIRRPKYWSFSFNISPFNEYSELISFRIDWFDLVVQGTLKRKLITFQVLCPSFFPLQVDSA